MYNKTDLKTEYAYAQKTLFSY